MISITEFNELSPSMAPPFQFGTTDFTPAAGIVVATPLLVSLRNHGWDRHSIAGCVDGNKSQMRRGDVLRGVRDIVFDIDFDTDFHRSMKYTIHRRAQNYQIADPHRHQEIDVIDGCGDYMLTRMPVRSHGSRQIDPVHQPAT